MFGRVARFLGLRSPCVPSAVLGQLIFPGPDHEDNAEEDRSSLGRFFDRVEVSRGSVPTCGVLFIYGSIEPDGSLAGASHGLREIIRESGAWIVVVASENSGDRCLAASAPTGFGEANLVLVLARKGPLFTTFIVALFQQMAAGVSMPTAWVRLSPQDPHGNPHALPDTVFLCERGRLVLPRPRVDGE
jgi:hypothetical protein